MVTPQSVSDLQWFTAPTVGFIVRCALVYDTWSRLIVIHDTMKALQYICDNLQLCISLLARVSGDMFKQDNAWTQSAIIL